MFTEFQGAFSDNALRWLVIFPVLVSLALSDLRVHEVTFVEVADSWAIQGHRRS